MSLSQMIRPGYQGRPKMRGDVNVKYLRWFVFIMFIIFYSGCLKSPGQKPPETPSRVLNELVQKNRFQYINVDDYSLSDILINDDDIILNLSFDEFQDSVSMGHLTNYTFVDDKFYIYDIEANAVFKVTTSGRVEGPLTSIGRGPGEHISVGNVKINSQFLYVSDPMNGRINRYGHDFSLKGELSGFTSLYDFDLNDDTILAVNRQSIGLNPIANEQGVIVASSATNLSDTLATFFPRIIPEGFQPTLYNIPQFSINERSNIAASYQFLPWIFLYDEYFKHMNTIILTYSKFEEFDVPEMYVFESLDNQGFGGDFPITGFKLMPDNEIMIFIRRELIHLVPYGDPEDMTYEVAGRYTFTIEGEEEPLWISDIFMSDEDNEYYVGSWYNIFRFRVEN